MIDFSPVIIDLEDRLICKIDSTDFTAKITEWSIALAALESDLSGLISLTNQLDDERVLVQPVQAMMDCKITDTTLQIKIAAARASLDIIESELARIGVLANTLETGVLALP